METQAVKETMRRARQTAQQGQLEWQANRAGGRVIRRELTDAIQAFIEYARDQGSVNGGKYFMIISKMVNAAVLGEQASKDPHFRDRLDAGQLMALAFVERVAAQAIHGAIQAGEHYKAVYQSAKTKVTTLAGMMNGAGVFPALSMPANSPGTLSLAG